MPRAIFLLPGVGAQGGSVEELAPAFAPHPAAGLVTASRSIVNAFQERGGEPARAAADAAEELRAAAWSRMTPLGGIAPYAAPPPPGSKMHESGPRSPARLLAPLALVVFALAVASWC